MQEQQALQDLPAPTSQDLGLHHLEPLQVPGGRVELTAQLTCCYPEGHLSARAQPHAFGSYVGQTAKGKERRQQLFPYPGCLSGIQAWKQAVEPGSPPSTGSLH